MKRVLIACTAVAALSTGCGDAATPADYGDPTALDRGTVALGLYVRVVSPSPVEVLQTDAAELVVEAWPVDEAGEQVDVSVTVTVRVDDGTPRPALAADAGTYRVLVPLSPGTTPLRVRVVDDATGRLREVDYALQRAASGGWVRITGAAAPVDGACPEPEASWPTAVSSSTLCVWGEASGDVRAKAADEVTAELDDSGAFEAIVALTPDTTQAVQVSVDGASDELRIVQDATPPQLDVTEPASAWRTGDAWLLVQGTAQDEGSGLLSLVVSSDAGGAVYVPALEAWEAEVRLAVGAQVLTVTATDVAGNEATATLDVVREREIVLGAPQAGGGSAALRLDRDGIAALYDEEAQRDLVLARLDLLPTLASALRALTDPERSGIDTSDWGTPEWTLWRLLNMTPDTADLRGTSFESMLTVAEAIGLPGPRLLADLFDLQVDQRFLSDDVIAAAILDGLVATHPEAKRDVDGNVVVDVTLYDALRDLAPLGERLGPVGQHPGVVDGPVIAEVFEPGFAMSLQAQTNLAELQGVDLSRESKAFVYRLDGAEVLEFDFEDPDAFAVVGLVDEPTVSMTFRMLEHDGFLQAGTTRDARPSDLFDGFYLGDSSAWDVLPWTLERVVIDAGFRAFAPVAASEGYERQLTYAAGSIDEAARVTWSRGWVTVDTSADIGSPPSPRYAWDVLAEAAQVRMHDELAEGEANVRFELDRIPIGLTSSELIDAMRPTLQDQRDILSRELLGASGLAASGADFFYTPGTAGQAVLFFRAPGDDGGEFRWDTPGFFADPDLTRPLSSTAPVAGLDDTTHHKTVVEAGDELFAADDEGNVFLITVVRADADGVALRITPRGAR